MDKKLYDKKVAVVILNWNGIDYLKKFIPVLIANSTHKDVDLYVADNGSTDESLDFLEKNYPEIKIIRLDKNYGFAGGYNLALRKISAEYYIILNSDVETTPDWIFPIIKKMDAAPEIAAAMPKIKAYHNKKYFEYAGASGGFIDKYGYPFCRGRIINTIEQDEGQYDDEREIFWASGACLFIRSEVFHAQNGFDDDFFAHMEEIDLCWRIKNTGYKIKVFPEVTVYHVGGGALPNNSPRKLYLNYRNNLFLLYKNLPADKKFLTIFIRMILDGVSAVIYLFHFQFSFFYAVLKAHFAFYKSIKKLKEKRKGLTGQNNKYKHPELYDKSLLWNYFINKTKSFDKLKI